MTISASVKQSDTGMTFDSLKAEGIAAWYRSTQKVSLTEYLRRWMFLNKWRLENGRNRQRV